MSQGFHGVQKVIRKTGVKCEIRASEKAPFVMEFMYKGRRYKRDGFETPRAAALYHDRVVIENGMDRPLNILKPK